MKNPKSTLKPSKYDFHKHYEKMFFTHSEISSLLLAAFVLYESESRRVDDLDILEFLESNEAPDYETIDDKISIFSDNRKKLLMRKINMILKLNVLYHDGLEVNEDGDFYSDSNFDAIIDEHFSHFLDNDVSTVA